MERKISFFFFFFCASDFWRQREDGEKRIFYIFPLRTGILLSRYPFSRPEPWMALWTVSSNRGTRPVRKSQDQGNRHWRKSAVIAKVQATGLQTQMHHLEQVHEVEIPYNMAVSWSKCSALACAPTIICLIYGDDNNRDDFNNDPNPRSCQSGNLSCANTLICSFYCSR